MSSCGSKERELVQVFAASSVVPVLEQLARQGEPAFTVTGGSSALMARQILAGAPADVLISAHRDWTEALVKRNVLARQGRFVLMHNTLVFVARRGLELEGVDWRQEVRRSPQRVAVADFEMVPLGMYTAQVLRATDLQAQVGFVVGQHAQATLRLVASGEADYGFVFATDASLSDGVVVVAEVDASLHEAINYVVVPLTERGKQWCDVLVVPQTVDMFRAAGFAVDAVKGRAL